MEHNSQFDWIPFYMEFADKLLEYKNNRSWLLAMLEHAHQKAYMRYPFVDKGRALQDICPFTIFGCFNKGITNSNRISILKTLATKLNIQAPIPTRFDGVPIMNNMNAWFFRGEGTRDAQDIENLWVLYEDALKYADKQDDQNRRRFSESYNKAIKQKGISWNITVGLFWVRPNTFLNLDGRNRQFLLSRNNPMHEELSHVEGLRHMPNAEKYLHLISICETYFSYNEPAFTNFPELSSTAWKATTTGKIDNEKTVSEAAFLQWFGPLIQALKDLGGAGTPDAVRKQIISNMNLSEETINEVRGKTGQRKFDNEVAFARQYLVFEGIIDKSQHGLWALTEDGHNVTMNRELASEIFYHWQKIHADRRKNSGVDRETTEPHIWLFTPGEGASMWDEFYAQSVMAIGWSELGDLSQYADREAIRQRMDEAYEHPAGMKKSGSLEAWTFANALREGDIVFVRKALVGGVHEVIGRGTITSDYMYAPDRGEYQHTRIVSWTHKGSWDYEGKNPTRRLVDITEYTDYVQKLEMLVAGGDVADTNEVEYEGYTENDFLNEVYMDAEQYELLKNLLRRKRNLILQGAPGVGKTFAARRLAYSMIGEKDTRRVMMVQFHQSYSYEDFIMGFRPTKEGFELTQGAFYTFCKNAQDDLERDYFFIIDEINRGNLSKVFGELLMLIESDKRGEQLRLLYSNELFSVPNNVYIIGLMNTADRSLAMIDYALRRRFAFFELAPGFDSEGFIGMMNTYNHPQFNKLVERVKELNDAIGKDEALGDGFKIGHSYFCAEDEVTDEWLSATVNFEIIPLLQEYWFDEKSKIDTWAKRLRGALND